MITRERVTRTAAVTSAAALVALLTATPALADGTKVRERGTSTQSTGSQRGGSARVESGSKVPSPPPPRVAPSPPSTPRSATPRVDDGSDRRDRDDRKIPSRGEVDRGTPRHHYPYYRHYYPYHRSYWNWGFYWGVPYYWGDWDYYYYHRRPYGYGYPHPYQRRYDYGPSLGALDLDVSPERAEIYLDGERVGIADEYDGFPGYLWLEPGTYDLVIYAPGFRTVARQISIQPGVIYDVEDRMTPGEAQRPEELVSTSTVNRDERLRRDRERAEAAQSADAVQRAEVERWEDRPWDDEEERREPMDEDVARIHFHVLPGDAAIYLDGYFVGTADEVSRLSAGLMVDPGEHTIEVSRPGFREVSREVDLDEGDRVDVEIELDRD